MSATDAVGRFLSAFERFDDPHVFLSVASAAELSAVAAAIDARPADEVPLRGLTFAVKDNIDVAGMPTTAACAGFAYEPERSATVVARLIDAGAVPVAKTNLDQFATGLVGTRSPFGVPTNPIDPALVPGGSSAGSAVAVAARLVDFALGTDTAGSGRVPAAFCDLVGMKPTFGRLPTTGVVPAVRSADCVSVFAGRVGLARRVAALAAGVDGEDPFARVEPVSVGRASTGRLGVLDDGDLRASGASDDVIAGYRVAVDALVERHGFELVSVPVDGLFAAGDLLYGSGFVAERTWAVGDAIEAHPDSLDATVAEIVGRGGRFDAVAAHDAAYQVAALRMEVDAWMGEVDAFVTPTVPRAVTRAEVEEDPFGPNTLLGRFTTFANLLDLAAISVPGPGKAAPARSVTLYGPAWADEALAGLAATLTGEVLDREPPAGWVPLVVAGAHLKGQPLAHQLEGLGAQWAETTQTSMSYRLYALAGGPPFKPALVFDPDGSSIEVDVWHVSPAALGTFLTMVPAPLALGTVSLADGRDLTGFVSEPRATNGATEITRFGGWRAFVDDAAAPINERVSR